MHFRLLIRSNSRTLVVCLLLLGARYSSFSQQNLFNVPSSDITLKDHVFFQQQVNFLTDGLVALNTTFCYGLGKDFEVGGNVLGVLLDPHAAGPLLQTNSDASQPPVYPFFTVNLQKAFVLNRTFKVGIGTQAGFSPGMHFGNFTYLNLVTVFPKQQIKLITGINHGSETILGPGDLNPYFSAAYDPIGFQFGFEKEIVHSNLLLLGEHISGTHSLGISVLGLGYHITDDWVLSAGWQFSSGGNPTPNSFVLEFTFVPSTAIHHNLFHKGHPEID